jgi:hypothetical protein
MVLPAPLLVVKVRSQQAADLQRKVRQQGLVQLLVPRLSRQAAAHSGCR